MASPFARHRERCPAQSFSHRFISRVVAVAAVAFVSAAFVSLLAPFHVCLGCPTVAFLVPDAWALRKRKVPIPKPVSVFKQAASSSPSARTGGLRQPAAGTAGRRSVARAAGEAAFAAGSGILGQWRAERRARLLKDLDWTRYHLWVYFVDATEPSFTRARLARLFFERICDAKDTGRILYCAAGAIRPTLNEESAIGLATAVPGLDASDLQNFALPPYEFSPADMSMYDVIVAADEKTKDRVRWELGGSLDPDHLVVLGDFVDAHDALAEAPGKSKSGSEDAASTLRPGLLTTDDLAKLQPGMPLQGRPAAKGLAAALDLLPPSWHSLWDAPGVTESFVEGETSEDTPDEQVQTRQVVAHTLRSIVGLEAVLERSIPPEMPWWNDEE
eukprot:TRINITY_DN28712_c0_g1_i1.p1 TRINITY_DN28712_c0_g1~~TRINITY_DN28712_c0_g1_i1.p1  ORF type:complete len:388 (-),score=57.55 TRINITY_DN28712_c0_g1_i1:613-1776(-)